MNFVIAADYSALSSAAADRIESLARAKPNAVLGLPTGETPVGVYREFARRVRESRLPLPLGEGRGEGLDLSHLTIFVLDEYLDVGRGDPRCLADWLDRDLIRPCEIAPGRVHVFDGLSAEPTLTCAEYEAAIVEVGGIDLQLLGLGPNGHVGFNEPGSRPDSRSRVVRLAAESIASNARYWGGPDRVPRYGLTMGLATLRQAR
ncbi:MAG: glucosamine-6-phosphate deaminase, partial [Chloroflexi bacterium]|nr:glucosamine-6-phosphate deaminase [Chloroflexota bacterium]